MKKVLNICVLLLSLVGCSNSVISTNSSTCPCEGLMENNTKYTIETIENIAKDDVIRIASVYKSDSTTYEIKEEYFDIFFDFVNKEYTMTNRKYIDDNFIKYKETAIQWIMLINENYGVGVNQIFDENGNSYLLLFDADPYISDLITKEENESFFNTIGY